MNHYDMLIYRSLHQDLSVRDLNVSWRQGTSASAHIRWSGRNEPTFTTSDTLPAGVTMSTAGLVSYDGTACTPDTYSWTVTATDGTSTVTATVTLVMAYATLVIGAGQSFEFKLGTASSQQIQYTADGTPAFAVSSGSLPAGVTMSTAGLVSYDGTGSTETTASVEVTATMQYAQTATATVGVALKTYVIPTDYVFYAPLKTDINDHSTSARTGTLNGSDSSGVIIGDVKDGVTCTYVPSNTRILYSLGDIPTGGASRTMSIWVWTPDTSSSWNSMMGYGAGTRNNMFALCYNAKKWAFGGYFMDIETDVPVTSAWHNLVATYDGTEILLYLDGTEIGSLETSAVDTSSGYDLGVAGRGYRNEGICEAAWFAAARIYNRVLTGDEITALANEDLTGGDTSDSSSSGGSDSSSSSTGGIPTDYAFYASLRDRSATSESGHTLTYSTSNLQPTVVDGVPCMNFLRSATGSSNAKISTDFSLVSNTSPFTMSCWMWLDSNSYDSGLWGISGFGFRASVLTSSYNYALHTTIYENPLTGRIFSSPSPTVKAWHCIVFTGDGNGSCTLYIDGVNVGTSTYTNYTQSYNLQIGNGTGGNSFNGYLAAYRFYRRALTGDELTALYNEDLTGGDTSDSSSSGTDTSDSSSSGGSAPEDYAFRAPLQTSLDDVSASARTATEDGGTATVGEVKDGVTCTYIPQAVKVKYPIGDVAIGSSPRTVSLWFWTPYIDSAWNTMFCYGTNSERCHLYAMGYHQSGKYAFTAYYNDLDSGLGTATASTWHNFVTTYDGTAIKVYVDGVLKGSKTTSDINTTTSDIVIGGRTYSVESANSMWYADIRIYNRALTDAEVAALASQIH